MAGSGHGGHHQASVGIPIGKLAKTGIGVKGFGRGIAHGAEVEIDFADVQVPAGGATVYTHRIFSKYKEKEERQAGCWLCADSFIIAMGCQCFAGSAFKSLSGLMKDNTAQKLYSLFLFA
ncbi:MAG: hypothetical protein P8Z73_03675 [Desulfobacteraceae bacterium]